MTPGPDRIPVDDFIDIVRRNIKCKQCGRGNYVSQLTAGAFLNFYCAGCDLAWSIKPGGVVQRTFRPAAPVKSTANPTGETP